MSDVKPVEDKKKWRKVRIYFEKIAISDVIILCSKRRLN